jgi:Family of unknown function (DUF6152)
VAPFQKPWRKIMQPILPALAAGMLLVVTAPAMAHHSFAMFASDKTITLTGTVKEFEWTNPHSWLHVMVTNDSGMPEEWAFEMGSPAMMSARGWKVDSVKVGDKVTVTAHPLKDAASHGGSEMSVRLPSGTVLGSATPATAGSGPYQ